MGTIHLPDGALLKGTVTDGSSNPRANAFVEVRMVGTNVPDDRFFITRTQVDGSYSVSMPAGATIARLCVYTSPSNVCPPTGSGTGSSAGNWQFFDGVTMGTVGTTKIQDFDY